MGKRIFLISVICLLFDMMWLSSCSKDDGEPHVDPKEKAWWGYFEGTFEGTQEADNMSVSFENERFNTRIGSNIAYYSPNGARDDMYNFGIKDTGIEYIDGSGIGLSISGLVPGMKYVTKSFRTEKDEDLFYSTIMLTRRYSADYDPVYYVPKEDDPFIIEILDVKWFSLYRPVVEARLEGTLYRKDAPEQDRITIKAVFGAGYGMQ